MNLTSSFARFDPLMYSLDLEVAVDLKRKKSGKGLFSEKVMNNSKDSLDKKCRCRLKSPLMPGI